MGGAGMMGGPGMMGGKPGPIAWGRMFRWGLRFINYRRSTFLLSMVLVFMGSLMALYQPLLLGRMNAELNRMALAAQASPEAPSPAAHAGPAPAGSAGSKAAGAGVKNGDSWYGRITDAILPSNLSHLVWLFFGIILLSMVLDVSSRVAETKSDSEIAQELALRLHDKALTLGPSFHQENPGGRLSAVVTQFSQGAQQTLCELYRSLIIQAITFVLALYTLIHELAYAVNIPPSWMAGLVGLVVVFPLVGWQLSRLLMGPSERLTHAFMNLQEEFLNSGTQPLEIQVMRANRQRSQAFGRALSLRSSAQVSSALAGALNQVFNASSSRFIQAAILVAMLSFIPDGPIKGAQTAGAVVAVILLIPQALRPVQQMVSFFAGINLNYPRVKVVLDLMETEPDTQDVPGKEVLGEGGNDLRLENVTFSYTPDGRRILDNLSFVFPAGKKTAIVGRSGSGKSTIFGLFNRLWTPGEGEVFVGGRKVRDLDLDHLRTDVFQVSQMPLFITGSLRDNFLLANENATDREMEDACRRTGIWKIMEEKAAAGEAASPLDLRLSREAAQDLWSGGQRRILALTRALLVHPRILLADEPTTGLDAQSAREVGEVLLGDAFAGMTMIIVDHSPEFLRQVCNVVACLEDGAFKDWGSSEEMAQRPSLFRELLSENQSKPRNGSPPPGGGKSESKAEG
ncbi:MAG: ABC transporter ATP-binding protein/permease [Proteobacteria bacterium]|nr:ABC transporter ATP-binding protein/permease [Pseudomonadota bacterium]